MIAFIAFSAILATVTAQYQQGYPQQSYQPQSYQPQSYQPQSYQPQPQAYQSPPYQPQAQDYQPQPQPQAYRPQASPQQSRSANPAAVHYVDIGPELAGNYKFGYDTGKGADGQSFREETRLADGSVQGAYGYTDETGKQRIIRYTAGKDGYQVEGDGIPKAPAAPAQSAPAAAAPQYNQYNPPQYGAGRY